MAKKRERMDIINDILVSIQKNSNKIKPTRLLYKSNLSTRTYQKHIVELEEKGFLKTIIEKKQKYFTLQEAGYEFILKYKAFSDFVESFGL
jgi:predicted transcriptional regulator